MANAARINDVPSEIAEAVHTYDGAVTRAREPRRVRHCIARGCNRRVPCPQHGVPAEDDGTWLWGRH